MLLRCGVGDGIARSADWVCTAAQQVTETTILSSAVTKRGCNFFVPSENCLTQLFVVDAVQNP